MKDIFPEVRFKENHSDIFGTVQKEPICEKIEEVDLTLLCEKVWPTLAVIGGLDRGLRVDGKCYDSDLKLFGTILGTLKKGFTTAKVLMEDRNDYIR